MKKRIFLLFSLFSITVTLLTAIVVAFVYYDFYRENVRSEIQSECTLIAAGLEEVPDNNALLAKVKQLAQKGPRMTLIAEDGSVLFDSSQDASTLPNHMDRAELQSAKESGTGEAVRYSETLRADTYYYALRLPDGQILRLSRPMDTITEVFADTVPLVIALLFVLILLSLAVSSLLTRTLVRPITLAAKELDNVLDSSKDRGEIFLELRTYEELSPFITKLRQLRGEVEQYLSSLREERDTIASITRNMSEGLIFLNREKTILSINRRALELMDVPRDNDHSGENILHLTRDPQLQEALDQVLSSGQGTSFDETDRSGIARRYFVTPAIDTSGCSTDGVMVFIVDSTAEMKAERIRREFAANVSHELKTPLTSINGFAEMIENGMIHTKEDIRGACARIHREASRLITLVEDIMRLSAIENHEGAKEERASCPMEGIVREATLAVEQAARQKRVLINWECDDTAVFGIRSMLYELIFNLMDNAVKYNRPDGRVEVSVHTEGSNAVISVRDTGIGIPQEHLERIFERFYRVDKSRSKQTGGTGLGLSIVKHIVELHQGHIQVESKEGSGTCITVILPLSPNAA